LKKHKQAQEEAEKRVEAEKKIIRTSKERKRKFGC